jgi:hypothetical protein
VTKDSNVDFVKVLRRFSIRAATLKNSVQSGFNDLSFFNLTNESICSCCPDEQATRIMD